MNPRLFLLALLVGLAVTLPSILAKPCVTPDGVRHVAAAQSLIEGKGLLDYDGQPLKSRPPLYSIALALPLSIGLGRNDAVMFVNLFCAAAIFALAYLILGRVTHGRGFVTYLWAGAIALLPTVTQACNTALSEPLALALTLGLILALLEARRKPWPWLLVSSVLGIAVCLTRYAGLGIVLGLAAGMGISSWLPALALALPSVAVTGAFYAWAGNAGHEVGMNLPGILPSIGEALVGITVPLGGAVGAALVVAGGLWFLWKHRDYEARLLTVAWLVYCALIIGANAAVNLGGLEGRMMIPVVVLATIVFAAESHHRWRRAVAAGLVIYGTVSLVSLTVGHTKGTHTGFNSPAWAKSEIIVGVATSPGMDAVVRTNSPTAVWWNTGKVTRQIPYSEEGDSAIRAGITKDTNYWVWFRQFLANRRYVSPEQAVTYLPIVKSWNLTEAVVLALADSAEVNNDSD